MKALSLTPWWAHVVVHHGKSIENRKWNTNFRGEFLIHASKGSRRDSDATIEWLHENGFIELALEICAEEVISGGIVGRATLVTTVAPEAKWGLLGNPLKERSDRRWHMREQYGFVLSGVKPLPFVPCKGALGFWEVPADVLAKVEGIAV